MKRTSTLSIFLTTVLPLVACAERQDLREKSIPENPPIAFEGSDAVNYSLNENQGDSYEDLINQFLSTRGTQLCVNQLSHLRPRDQQMAETYEGLPTSYLTSACQDLTVDQGANMAAFAEYSAIPSMAVTGIAIGENSEKEHEKVCGFFHVYTWNKQTRKFERPIAEVDGPCDSDAEHGIGLATVIFQIPRRHGPPVYRLRAGMALIGPDGQPQTFVR